MTFSRHNPEWTRREVVARVGIGLAGGVIGTIVGNVLWPWTRTTADRFLVDRVVFIAVSSIVVSVLLRVWYGRSFRADIVSAVIASSLTLWLNVLPFLLLRAVIKPVAPDLWSTRFGNPNDTLAYAVVYGPCVAIALVFAVPLCRTWLSDVLREPRRWAVRVPRQS